MELDKEKLIQDLEEWHENHLYYYADNFEHIRRDGHRGLDSILI